MSKKYTVRVASPVAYEFWAAEADTFEELLEAEQELRELKDAAGSADPVQERGIKTLEKGGLRTSLPGLQKGGLGQGRQAQSSSGDDDWKGVELGKLNDGTVITVHAKGKHGPYVKAYIPADKSKVYANLPKGASVDQIDLDTAVELIEAKMAG